MKKSTEVPRLDTWERWLSGIAGLAFATFAYLAYSCPPSGSVTEHEGPLKNGLAESVEEVFDPTNVVIALIIIAAVLLFTALMGVRFNRFSLGGNSMAAETTTGEIPVKVGAEITENKLEVAAGGERDEGAWDRLPNWAQEAVLEWAGEHTDGLTTPLKLAVIDSEKASGRGNLPWLVSVRMDDGSIRVVQTATGRGGYSIRSQTPAV